MNKKNYYQEDHYESKRGRDKSEKRTKSQGRFSYLKHVDNGDDIGYQDEDISDDNNRYSQSME